MGTTMAKKRIVSREEEPYSRQIRAYTDLADMLKWVIEFENADRKDGEPLVTMASWIDPLLRPQVTAAYKQIAARAKVIKKAKGETDAAPDI
ncbi:hypothetical protein [Zavarzinella formosa]|uniref:hypothetical protein n=1 Tax=Zavarzinella formosa TaxID=360055 RepID=UPI00031F6494|nr:hypothetical protein [Zavarzinella formosa]